MNGAPSAQMPRPKARQSSRALNACPRSKPWRFAYQTTYAAPGAPELAARVRDLLAAAARPVDETERGLDHGAYVPMIAMYPDADVPVLQLSLPSLAAPELFAL